MIDQINQQLKTGREWITIASLVIGVVSIIPIIMLFSGLFLSKKMFLLSFFSIVGIVFGVKGLSYTKKNLAIGGIIFSTIGLVGLITLLLIWLAFATGM